MKPDPLDVALGFPDPPAAPPVGAATGPAGTVAWAETVDVGTEWVVSGHVRVRRRVVTERRTIEIEVRREVLEVDGTDVDFRDGRLFGVAAGPVTEAPAPARTPVVVVLHEEVPRIVPEIRPYERVTVTTERATRVLTVDDQIHREVVDVDVIPSPRVL